MNCLHSFRIKNRLKSHEKLCRNKDFCGIVLPSEKDNMLEFNQCIKSNKMPYIIYADFEFLIKKIDRCSNNPENSSTTKIGEHILYGYSLSTIYGLLIVRKTSILYIVGKIVWKKIRESLWEDAKNILDFEKKKMLPLTKEE